VRTFLSVLALVCLAGCADLKSMMALSAALQEHYHVPANVGLRNGSHLTITLDRSELEDLKLDSTGVAGFARDMAGFAKAHYDNSSQLDDIGIAIETKSEFAGAKITQTTPYSFKVSELP
jgi:hypothetical protein